MFLAQARRRNRSFKLQRLRYSMVNLRKVLMARSRQRGGKMLRDEGVELYSAPSGAMNRLRWPPIVQRQ